VPKTATPVKIVNTASIALKMVENVGSVKNNYR